MSLLPLGWRPYLPLTLQIIAHPVVERNRQNTQNWDFYLAIICATFLLTNCWQCGIMKIPATVGCGRRAKIKRKGWHLATLFSLNCHAGVVFIERDFIGRVIDVIQFSCLLEHFLYGEVNVAVFFVHPNCHFFHSLSFLYRNYSNGCLICQ